MTEKINRPWRHIPVPIIVVGRTIEHWNKVDEASWFQMIGLISNSTEGAIMKPDDVTHMEFHDHPPCPTEGGQVWRIVG